MTTSPGPAAGAASTMPAGGVNSPSGGAAVQVALSDDAKSGNFGETDTAEKLHTEALEAAAQQSYTPKWKA